MEAYKIIKAVTNWKIVVDDPAHYNRGLWDDDVPKSSYPQIVKNMLAAIHRNKIPYIQAVRYFVHYGTAYTGGAYIKITLNPLTEAEDRAELEQIIEKSASNHTVLLLRYRKKLTTFLPTPLRWSR